MKKTTIILKKYGTDVPTETGKSFDEPHEMIDISDNIKLKKRKRINTIPKELCPQAYCRTNIAKANGGVSESKKIKIGQNMRVRPKHKK